MIKSGSGAAPIGATNGSVEITVVIPVFNEVDGIDACYAAVHDVLRAASRTWEIIFVDDGCTDDSPQKLKALADADRSIKVISLKRNFGQQKALLAGLARAGGEAIVAFDADLQSSPDCIPKMAEMIIENGMDVVSGIRQRRRDSLLRNRLPSLLGRFLINRALGTKVHDFGGPKAFSRQLAQIIVEQPGDFPVVYASAFVLSNKYCEIPVDHHERIFGSTKWSLLKRIELYFDVYVCHAERPFSVLFVGGCVSLVGSILVMLGVVYYKLFIDSRFSGNIFLLNVLLLFFGFNFVVLSLIGEFVVRIFRSRSTDLDDMIRSID